MFDSLKKKIQAIKDLDGAEIVAEIVLDDQGYRDRQCPSTACGMVFKAHNADWRELFRDEEVWCPHCGHTAPAKEWKTKEQQQYSSALVHYEVKRRLHGAGHPPQRPAALEPMPVQHTCVACHARTAANTTFRWCACCGVEVSSTAD